MKLHILTLNWNGKEELKSLFPRLKDNLDLLKEKNDIDYEWHIKDNGSKDGSLDYARGLTIFGLNVSAYSIGHNRDNFSKGVNYLFKKANTDNDDLILLLNNDVSFGDNTSIIKMFNLLTPDVGVVGAKLKYTNSNKLQHAGVIFSERYGKMPYHFKHKEECDKSSNVNRYFQAVTGACCLLRASDFLAVNGMNEFYFWAFEDIDFCLKIGQNKKIAYCGETNIYHKESATLEKNPVNKMFLQQNVKLFKDRWFGKYEIDHDKYLNDNSYNEIKAK